MTQADEEDEDGMNDDDNDDEDDMTSGKGGEDGDDPNRKAKRKSLKQKLAAAKFKEKMGDKLSEKKIRSKSGIGSTGERGKTGNKREKDYVDMWEGKKTKKKLR